MLKLLTLIEEVPDTVNGGMVQNFLLLSLAAFVNSTTAESDYRWRKTHTTHTLDLCARACLKFNKTVVED